MTILRKVAWFVIASCRSSVQIHPPLTFSDYFANKSGNFLAFRAETRKNTEKSEKTGFGMVNETAPGPVFCVFGVKKLRTFYFKLTEQSSREKLEEGGFEPKNDMMQ